MFNAIAFFIPCRETLAVAAAKDHPGNNSDDEYVQVAAAGLKTAAAAVSNPDFWENFTNKDFLR